MNKQKNKKCLANISLDVDFLEVLKKKAEKRGVKYSEFVVDWLSRLGLEKDNVKRVILQVPDTAFVSKAHLQTWLKNRSEEIVNHYFKEENLPE